MSARSAQRTRWRRWRMGWDIAGRIRSRRKTSGQDTSSRAAQASPWPRISSPSSFMPSKKRNARGARDRSTTRQTRGASAAAAAAATSDPEAAGAADHTKISP